MALTQIKPAGLSKPVDLADNEKIRLGTGTDLQIYHDGTHSRITNDTGTLFTLANEVRFKNNANNETLAAFVADGAVELYHNNSKKLETTSNGISVAGDVAGEALTATNTNAINLADSKKINLGTGSDLQIYHDGSDSFVQNSGTGGLRLESDQTLLRSANSSETYISTVKNGAVELYYDNSKKFETLSTGAKVFGDLHFPDSEQIKLGNGNDFIIGHNGTNSTIQNFTGNLRIRTVGQLQITKGSTENMIVGIPDGAVELYHNNSKKLETVSGGVYVYGQFIFGVGTSDALHGGDNNKIILGSGNDLQIHHDGSNSKIQNSGGRLHIENSAGNIRTQTNHGLFIMSADGNTTHAEIDNEGLKFNGDTAAANALDDYEEGTWTPSISYANNAGTTSGRVNVYRKIGNMVYFTFDIFQTNNNMGININGTSVITGLPFSSTVLSSFNSTMNISTYTSSGGGQHLNNYIDSTPQLVLYGNGEVYNLRHVWGFGCYPTS